MTAIKERKRWEGGTPSADASADHLNTPDESGNETYYHTSGSAGRSPVPTPPSLRTSVPLPPSEAKAREEWENHWRRQMQTPLPTSTEPVHVTTFEEEPPPADWVGDEIERLLRQEQADRIDAERSHKNKLQRIAEHLDQMGDTITVAELVDWRRLALKRIDRAKHKRKDTCPNRGGSFKSTAKLQRKGNKFKFGAGIGGDCGLPSCTSTGCREMWATKTAKRFVDDLMFSPSWYKLTVPEDERETLCETLARNRRRALQQSKRPEAHFTAPSSTPGTIDVWTTKPPPRSAHLWEMRGRSTAARMIHATIVDRARSGPVEAQKLAHISAQSLPEDLPNVRTWAAGGTNGSKPGQTEKWETVWTGISTQTHNLEDLELIFRRVGWSLSVNADGHSASAKGSLTEQQEIDLINALEGLFGYVEPNKLHRRKSERRDDDAALRDWEDSMSLEMAA